MPRNSENVPSVTISAGSRSREISTAFSPPPAQPTASATAAAAGIGQMQIAPRRAETDRGQPHHRADREIDAAGDQNRRQRDGEQAELGVQPRDLEEVGEREEIRRDDGEDRHFGRKRGRERGLMPAPGGAGLHSVGCGAGAHRRPPRRE